MTEPLSPFWHALLVDFALKAFFVVFGTPAVVSFIVGILIGCTLLGGAVHSGINVVERLIKNHTTKLLKAKQERPESRPSSVSSFPYRDASECLVTNHSNFCSMSLLW